MTNLQTTQIGNEAWVSNPVQARFSQTGVTVWYASSTITTNVNFSQIGTEVWYRMGTLFLGSQIGVEVWRSFKDMAPPAKGSFNMPMLGM